MIQVQVPPGMHAGDKVQVNYQGSLLVAEIPKGVPEGGIFQVPIPQQLAGGPQAFQPAPQAFQPQPAAHPGSNGTANMLLYGGAPILGGDMNRDFNAEFGGVNQSTFAAPGLPMLPANAPANINLGDGSLGAILMNSEAIMIEQVPHILELVGGLEFKNQYRVFICNPTNFMDKSQQILHITEDSECFERYCCGPFRSCYLNVLLGNNPAGQKIATIQKDFHLNLCFFFLRPKARLLDHNNAMLCEVTDPCTCCSIHQYIKDKSGRQIAQVDGTIFQCGICIPCADLEFQVYPEKQGVPEGKIVKVFAGLGELCLNINRFGIIFPKNMSAEGRAGLFTSAFLLDFQHFEQKNRNNNNAAFG